MSVSRHAPHRERQTVPAALAQGQPDFLGTHPCKRIDPEGTFHTPWSGDRTEISAVDTH